MVWCGRPLDESRVDKLTSCQHIEIENHSRPLLTRQIHRSQKAPAIGFGSGKAAKDPAV